MAQIYCFDIVLMVLKKKNYLWKARILNIVK